MVARATVCDTFQTGTQPDGLRIPILGGDVKLDGTAQIRSTLDLTTDGTGMWPQSAADPLAPYGNEVYVERGVFYSDDLVEYVGLGYFRIQGPDQGDAPDGPIHLEGRDRMAGITDGRLLAPVQFLTGTTLGAVFDTLVLEVYPDAVIEFDDGSDANVLVRPAIADEDRFGFLDNLVKSLGKVWYWDHRGVLVIRDIPDPGEPVFEVFAGEGGVLLELSRTLTRSGVYNAVVARGDATDSIAPAYGVAVDNSPLSPTYFFGRFGPVPRFYSSPFLTDDGQAETAAAAMVRRYLGLPYNVEFKVSPNPALEPFDPVTVRTGIGEPVETHVIETLTIPLVNSEPMTATTREQTVMLVGSP
jgi:hypothetical protein